MKVRRRIIPLVALFSMVVLATPIPSVLAEAASQEMASADVQAARMPKMIFIIRHGEKPPAEAGSPDLNERGQERAKAIPALFLSPGQVRFERPDVLFATRATKKSNRPVETIIPLSKALHLPIDDKYGRGELASLVQELSSGQYAGKVVLISWHHAEIQELANDLGATDAPAWPSTLFDRIWQIEWIHGKAHLTSLPQMLLPGDAQQ